LIRRGLAGIVVAIACAAGLALARPLDSEPGADAVLADLPFLPAAEGAALEVRVDLAPDGARPLPLLVDTGSPESFATPRAATDLGISLRRSKQTPYRRATRLGRDLELNVDTRRGETGAAANGEWAVLGARFVRAYVLEIDLPRRRVRFLDPERFEVPERVAAPREAVLPFRLAGHRPVIEIEIGGVKVPAAITTGAPGTLLLPGGYAEGAGLVPDPEATKSLAPLPGAGELAAVTAPRIRIGPFEQTDVPILVAERGAQGAGARSEALLGIELLQDYVVRLDYARKRFWIAERENP
jgi:predicted aspartyl protease